MASEGRTNPLPPHSIEAEEAVIAAALLDDSAVPRCQPILSSEDFFRSQNGEVWQACVNLFERGEEVTIPTVIAELDSNDEWGPYLVDIVGKYFTAVGVEAHAKIVARDAFYRRLIQAAGQIASIAYDGGPDARAVFAESHGLLLGLRPPYDADEPKRMGWADILTDEVGVPVDLPVIDKYLGGMCIPGQLITLAGPSGFGKSLIAAQIALAVAQQGKSVLIASMEMDDREYEWRIVTQLSGVQKRPLRYLSEDEKQSVVDAQALLETYPLTFWNKARLTLEQVRARATSLQADEGLDLLVIDYLQLMGLPNTRESEASKLGYVTSGLKQLATELDIQVLLLSQMNRGAAGEMRGRDAISRECLITGQKWPMPFIESLKGSGSIEQDSDSVLFLAKHPNCLPGKHASLVVGKNRHGMTGDCLLVEDFAHMRFARMTEDHIYQCARGDMEISKQLRIDQNYSTEAQYG